MSIRSDADHHNSEIPPKPTRNGPGWGFTIILSTTAFAAGIVCGMIADGSADAINGFKENNPYSSRSIRAYPTETNMPQAAQAEEQWFPENNKIDWSITLRPGVTTVPLSIHNDNAGENQRIQFHWISNDQAPQLVAVLYIKASQTARINLPEGSYRVDLISTLTSMPWDKATAQNAIPTYSLPIKAGKGDINNPQRLVITANRTALNSKRTDQKSEVQSSPKPASSDNSEPSDYEAVGVEAEPTKDAELGL